MQARSSVPVSFFSMAVGLLAFAGAWRVAARLWGLPQEIALALTVAGLAAWALLGVLYARKWWVDRDAALAELRHPVQSAFVALVPVASLLAAMALLPWSRPLAVAVYAASVAGALAIGAWLHGGLWQGGHAPAQVTPAVYLPAVAQNFVAATASAAFGWHELGALFFGAGLLSWLALESMILQRAAVLDALPEPLRPLLGIQLAPPVVGGVSWLSLNGGVPDLFAFVLLGYGVYQALLLARLLPWIGRQPFAAGYWAFSFGVAALPTLAMRMAEHAQGGLVAALAPVSFVVANLVFGVLVAKTLGLLSQGRLLPAAVPAAAPVDAAPVASAS